MRNRLGSKVQAGREIPSARAGLERSPTKTTGCLRVLLLLAVAVAGAATSSADEMGEFPVDAAAMREVVQADWETQERRLGRSSQSPDAIRAAVRRAKLLLDDLWTMDGAGDLIAEADQLRRLSGQAEHVDSLDERTRRDLYVEVRTVTRGLALKNPLVASRPILFMLRRRAVGYMLYEYLGWYHCYGNDPRSGFGNPQFSTPDPGGGVYVLDRPGQTMEVRDLTANRLPPGYYVTMALSFDARTVYFAYADPRGAEIYTRPGYAPGPARPGVRYNTFHIFAMDGDGGNLRQLTDGPHDDFDPCPLPDGGIAFESTRRGSKLRCGGGSPEIAYTLHRMDADGDDVRTLSFHETHEWHPSMLNDGRIVYTRWDYVDRNAAKFHGLWTCNPDGTQPSVLFGNYTTRPWACYQAKAIPGSEKIAFIAGGHHANVGGTLMLLDPSRVAFDPRSGEDDPRSVECLTPDVCFAESQGWPKTYFYSPWPLSEKYFLVAFSHDPLSGGYTGEYRHTETGLYYFDRFGNLELLFRCLGISAVYPIPMSPRFAPAVRVHRSQPELGDEGEFLLADVHKSLLAMPAGRRIKELRVFQLLPKSRTDQADNPRIGHPEQSNARMLLGSIPVEDDGSAYFRAPAYRPLYFQAVDESGRAVQGMRSIVYLQPGERRGCVGCHEPPGTAPRREVVEAARRPPSALRAGPDGTRPFCYPRMVQPLLDRQCVRCHDGSSGPNQSKPILTGEPAGQFSASYENLKPYLRWPSYDAVTRPGQLGADASPLSGILTSPQHRKHVELSDEDLRTVYLWLDAHVPFFGTYEEDGLDAQKRGLAVRPPSLQ